jgi:hypothetical protein
MFGNHVVVYEDFALLASGLYGLAMWLVLR